MSFTEKEVKMMLRRKKDFLFLNFDNEGERKELEKMLPFYYYKMSIQSKSEKDMYFLYSSFVGDFPFRVILCKIFSKR